MPRSRVPVDFIITDPSATESVEPRLDRSRGISRQEWARCALSLIQARSDVDEHCRKRVPGMNRGFFIGSSPIESTKSSKSSPAPVTFWPGRFNSRRATKNGERHCVSNLERHLFLLGLNTHNPRSKEATGPVILRGGDADPDLLSVGKNSFGQPVRLIHK